MEPQQHQRVPYEQKKKKDQQLFYLDALWPKFRGLGSFCLVLNWIQSKCKILVLSSASNAVTCGKGYFLLLSYCMKGGLGLGGIVL